MPLVAWTFLLTAILVAGRPTILGFTATALGAWIVFDVMLAWMLFRAARRPRVRRLLLLALAAAIDAALSVRHLATSGLGPDTLSAVLRLLATAGPILGTTALAWAASRAAEMRRRQMTDRPSG